MEPGYIVAIVALVAGIIVDRALKKMGFLSTVIGGGVAIALFILGMELINVAGA